MRGGSTVMTSAAPAMAFELSLLASKPGLIFSNFSLEPDHVLVESNINRTFVTLLNDYVCSWCNCK